MVVPEKEGCGTGGRAGRDRIGAVGRPAESTTRVGERADGGPAATRPGRLADPGANLARERWPLVSCAGRERHATTSDMPLSHIYASEVYRSNRRRPFDHRTGSADREDRARLVSRPHLPMRPLWRCRGCGALWPCQPARLALLAEYRDDRVGLLVYLATMMAEAGDQLARLDGRPADLHERFLGWARVRGGTMFHVNHEPGAQIHHTDPFAMPTGQRSPVRRLRGRLAAPVTLWTAPGPAGLTVSSTLVADGEPGRLLGLIDAGVRPLGGRRGAGRFAVTPLGPPHRQLADRFAGLLPAPGGLFAAGDVDRDAVRAGAGRRRRLGRLPAGHRPGVRLGAAGRGHDRGGRRWPRRPPRCCTTAVATTSCRPERTPSPGRPITAVT